MLSLATAGFAQTNAGPGGPSVRKMIRDSDYIAIRIVSNNLTQEELSSLRVKAEAGDVQAQVTLGMAYQQGCPGAVHDLDEALKWYHMAADQGNSIAANQIAVFYDPAERFSGIRGRDLTQAIAWYRKAAELGDLVGQYNLALTLRQAGRDSDAIEAYRRAIENGSSLAAVGLVDLYDQGRVLPDRNKHENWKAGVEYFQRLADQGNPGAEFVLAQEYREGWLGLHRDRKHGFDLGMKAAAQGWPRAFLYVGDCYFKGIGVRKDKTEALKWLQKAADQADPIGEAFMAWIYESGDGAPQDLVTAYTWFLLAKNDGADVRFKRHLTADEIAEAEKRAHEVSVKRGAVFY
jgi:uncharacterized protein